MKIKHGGIDADESGPSDQYNIPKKSSGPWHQFLKEYGKSEGIIIYISVMHTWSRHIYMHVYDIHIQTHALSRYSIVLHACTQVERVPLQPLEIQVFLTRKPVKLIITCLVMRNKL